MPSLELGFTAPVIVAVGAVIAAVLLAALAYRRTLPPVSPRMRRTLVFLRSTSLAVMLVLLLEPILRITGVSGEQPLLAVLVDNSASMQLRDAAGDRRTVVHGMLREAVRRLPFPALYSTFGKRTGALSDTPPDSLPLNEEATNIAGALQRVGADAAARRIGAVVLITDGVYTAGRNPLYEAEGLRLPVYTVGIGDSSEQRDILVSGVSANELAFDGSSTPVEVRIGASGYEGQRVTVGIAEGTRELARTTLLLRAGAREYTATLDIVPHGEGTRVFTARVSPLPDELTARNNRRSFSLRVLKSKLTVVLVAGLPGPDLVAVRQGISEDPHLRIAVFPQRQDGGFYGPPLTRQVLDSADCLVLLDFPTPATAGDLLSLITRSIEQRRIPLLFFAGRAMDHRRLGEFGGGLPFVTVSVNSAEQSVSIEPADRNHPLLLPDSSSSPWHSLPPIYRTSSTYKARPGALVLGVARIRTLVLPDPLLIAASRAGQKSVAVLAYGIWRWRLMAQGRPETEQLLGSFLSASIRWLTTREDPRRLRVAPTKPLFSPAESVAFEARVHDGTARPVGNASVRITVQGGDFSTQCDLTSRGNGLYEGALPPLAEGEYTYHASASLQGAALGTDSGRVAVGALALEAIDTRMAVHALRQIADRTGGAFYLPSEISALSGALRADPALAPRERRTAAAVEFRHWPFVLLLVLLLCAAEWFIRKRLGLL